MLMLLFALLFLQLNCTPDCVSKKRYVRNRRVHLYTPEEADEIFNTCVQNLRKKEEDKLKKALGCRRKIGRSYTIREKTLKNVYKWAGRYTRHMYALAVSGALDERKKFDDKYLGLPAYKEVVELSHEKDMPPIEFSILPSEIPLPGSGKKPLQICHGVQRLFIAVLALGKRAPSFDEGALKLALVRGDELLVERLLKCGVNPNVLPLSLALCTDVKCAQLLINHGVNIKEQEEKHDLIKDMCNNRELDVDILRLCLQNPIFCDASIAKWVNVLVKRALKEANNAQSVGKIKTSTVASVMLESNACYGKQTVVDKALVDSFENRELRSQDSKTLGVLQKLTNGKTTAPFKEWLDVIKSASAQDAYYFIQHICSKYINIDLLKFCLQDTVFDDESIITLVDLLVDRALKEIHYPALIGRVDTSTLATTIFLSASCCDRQHLIDKAMFTAFSKKNIDNQKQEQIKRMLCGAPELLELRRQQEAYAEALREQALGEQMFYEQELSEFYDHEEPCDQEHYAQGSQPFCEQELQKFMDSMLIENQYEKEPCEEGYELLHEQESQQSYEQEFQKLMNSVLEPDEKQEPAL